MSTTIKDVARLSGVSISTVSRVINNSKPVSVEVRKKVLKVIKEINYKPNEVARSLVTKKTFLIGVIVTDIGYSYVTEMVRGIEEVGKMYNYDILLCSTYGDKEMEERYMQILKRKQIDGIILISENLRENDDKLLSEYDIPLVYLNRFYRSKKYSTVTINNYEATYEMTKYLIELGHKDIKYIMYKNEESKNYESLEEIKLKGYMDIMKEKGYNTGTYYTEGCEIQNGYEIAKEVIESHSISAIFCSNDELAIGVMNYLFDNDIKVPEDISLVGYGNINMTSILRPRLTTVSEPYYDIGAVAIRRIIKEIQGDTILDKETILPYKIQKRESCSKI